MRVISCNVNGIRSAAKKGFWDWLVRQKADFVCLQETRATLEQFPKEIQNSNVFYKQLFDAQKKGYSGVALFSKAEPLSIEKGFGCNETDSEGRYLRFNYKNFCIISLYLPSGSAKDSRQEVKYRVLDRFYKHVQKLQQEFEHVIVCGDFNIAHKQIDIKNWKANQKNSGFLPDERAWMTKLLKNNFVDAMREINDKEHQYTWWSNRGQAYKNNVGWRIDYQIASSNLKQKIRKEKIYKNKKFSDHAPIIIDYDLSI